VPDKTISLRRLQKLKESGALVEIEKRPLQLEQFGELIESLGRMIETQELRAEADLSRSQTQLEVLATLQSLIKKQPSGNSSHLPMDLSPLYEVLAELKSDRPPADYDFKVLRSGPGLSPIVKIEARVVRPGSAPGSYGAGTADIQPNYATAAALATVDTVVDGIQTDLSNAPDGLGAIKAETALIVADTNELQTAATAPTAAAVADAVWDEALAGHVGAGSYGKAVADIETDATAILSDTNELQGDDVPGLIATLDAVVDTVKAETALILTDTGTTIPGTITTAQADLTQLQEGIIYGACGSASLTTTTCSTNLSGYTADQLIGRVIVFTALANGPATGEATDITDYAVTNGVLTFTALTLAPENLNSFKIV
jgi:hypothetical protein